jgi:hypothetical protein
MQVTSHSHFGVRCEDLWQWQANVGNGIATLNDKRQSAATHHLTEKHFLDLPIFDCKNVKTFTPPPLGTAPNAAASDNLTPQISQQERESIREYNGGREYFWQPTNVDTCAGSWQIDSDGYVENVLPYKPSCP